jgi:hypothetical protein
LVHWKQLAENLPEARFVFTYRDADEWVSSQLTKTKYARFAENHDSYWHWYITKVVGSCLVDAKEWKRKYLETTEAIRTYFLDSDRFVEINVFQDTPAHFWSKLTKFFDVPRKVEPIPRIRRGIDL